jgi:hypothetical protein
MWRPVTYLARTWQQQQQQQTNRPAAAAAAMHDK